MRSVIAFLAPFGFVAFLSGLMLSNREAAWAAFYSFLPIAFLFMGVASMELAKRIRRLEERIRELEGKV